MVLTLPHFRLYDTMHVFEMTNKWLQCKIYIHSRGRKNHQMLT